MKKVYLLIAGALTLISLCLIYLVKQGVSLRSEPIIRPSIISADQKNVAFGVITRLAPEFQNADYVIWGLPGDGPSEQNLMALMKAKYEEVYRKSVQMIEHARTRSPQEISGCQSPCWLIVSQDDAHRLGKNDFLREVIDPLKKKYFSITLVGFSRGAEVSPQCLQEKRLDFPCLSQLAIHEAERKMKEPGHKYFFMKRYLEKDYFLFLEND